MTRLAGGAGALLAVLTLTALAQEPTAKQKSGAAGKATANVASILAQMAQTYAEAKTYEDSGELLEVLNPAPDATPSRALFVTRYAEPDRWLFDGQQQLMEGMPPSRFTAWSPGTAKESFSQIAENTPVKSSSTKFGTGLINGVFTAPIAWLVPSLLGAADKDVTPDVLKADRKWKLVGSEKIGANDCHVLGGVKGFESEADIRLWVDKKTSLIRRYQEIRTRSPIPSEVMINLQPKLNEPIATTAFQPGSDSAKPAAKSGAAKKSTKARKKN